MNLQRWKKDLEAIDAAKTRYAAVSKAVMKAWPECMQHIAVSVTDVKTDRGKTRVQIRVGKNQIGTLELTSDGAALVSLRGSHRMMLRDALPAIRKKAADRMENSRAWVELEIQAQLLRTMLMPAARRPALRFFAPVTLAGIPYQLPSEAAPRGAGRRRGNLDILARRGKGSSASLAVLELKRPGGAGFEDCLVQAAHYARSVRDVVASKELGLLARKAFGTTKNETYRVRVDAIAVVHADDVANVRRVAPEPGMGVAILSYQLDRNSGFTKLEMLDEKAPPRRGR